MKLNISWGILAKGVPVTTFEYGRTFAETAYNGALRSMIEVLVPFADTDTLNRAHRIEELIKLIRRSSLKSRFDSFDSWNTYDKSTLQYPAPGFYTSAPVDLNPKIIGRSPVGRLRVHGVVSGGNTVTYDEGSDNVLLNLISNPVQNYSFNNGQSGDIPVADSVLSIRLRDDAPTDFDLGLEYIEKLAIDWEGLLTNLQRMDYDFASADLKEIWQDEYSWVEKVSAFTMDVLETCGG